MDYTEMIKAFGALFAIMNPFVNLPIFLAMTTELAIPQQRALAVRVVIFSAILCVAILFAGHRIIDFFGIGIDQFRIAGGIVLAHIAWSMLNGAAIASHHGTETEKDRMSDLPGLAFYPIAFPMIVGPGTVATLIVYAGHARGIGGLLSLAGLVGLLLAILFGVLFFASSFGKILSDTMRVIVTRLMGMILLAIAIEMMVAGVKSLLAQPA